MTAPVARVIPSPSAVGEKRFSVQMSDGRSFDSWQAPEHTNDPAFPLETSLRPGECADGWISYEVPAAESVVSVTYDVGDSIFPGFFAVGQETFTFANVPEPATLSLFAAGLVGLAMRRKAVAALHRS